MNYFVLAGEASGDLHASELMKALKISDPEATFDFLGGDKMASVAGNEPLIHYKHMAFMGFVDVLRNLGTVTRNLRRAYNVLEESRPDAVILVDYPSFNLRVAAKAYKLGIPVFYYISPKVWAWKEGRVKQIKKYVKEMYSILPFEVEFYKKRHDYDVKYVGNPSAEEVEGKIPALPAREDFAASHDLDPSKPIIALVPGSRISEIKSNLPIMNEVAHRHPEYQAVIAGAPGIDSCLYGTLSDLPVVFGSTFELVGVSTVALVTSGTATLETALLGVPQVVCFRHSGSKLVYNIYKRLLKIPFVSLPNLIAGECVVPEMLMHLCTADSVDRELCEILPGKPGREKMLRGYDLMRSKLGTSRAAATAAAAITARLASR